MKKLKDSELAQMTLDEIYEHWQALLGRKDFDKHEGYGERLLYWLEVKRWAMTASPETN